MEGDGMEALVLVRGVDGDGMEEGPGMRGAVRGEKPDFSGELRHQEMPGLAGNLLHDDEAAEGAGTGRPEGGSEGDSAGDLGLGRQGREQRGSEEKGPASAEDGEGHGLHILGE
jgi:hypothetical protein